MNGAYNTATHAVNKCGVVYTVVCESSACSDLSFLRSEFVTFAKAVVWCSVLQVHNELFTSELHNVLKNLFMY